MKDTIKGKVNAKWTSTQDYRIEHVRIFGHKVGSKVDVFMDGFGIIPATILSRNGDTYSVLAESGDSTFEVELNWDEIAIY